MKPAPQILSATLELKKYDGPFILIINWKKAPTYKLAKTSMQTLRNYVKFAVFMAVTMKNAVFWDVKAQFVPHRRHITSPLQRPAG
jgi:hypothetical protein